MRALLLYICALMVMLCMTGCNEQSLVDDYEDSPVTGQVDSVPVGFGLSVNSQTRRTRMSYDATQSNGNFRGISDFYLIPFAVEGVIGPDDVPLKNNIILNRSVNQSNLISNNNALFYKPVLIPNGTASFLIYGHAPEGVNPFIYGSLSGFENIENLTKASDITFSLDQIYSGTEVPTIGQELADYLTGIANTQYVLPTGYYGDIFYRVQRTPIYRWNNPDSYDNSVLTNAFEFFSNGDRVMGGSSKLISSLLTKLYNYLYVVATSDPTEVSYYSSSSSTTPVGTIHPYREMAIAIRAAIANNEYVTLTGSSDLVKIDLKYPRHEYPRTTLGLPDGAAGLQWNASAQEFQVVMQTKASAKIMDTSRFCYPPLLCYYANSRIKTSDADSEEEHYIPSNTWTDILNEYSHSSAKVTTNTQAVAIVDVVNYGVSQLRICLKPALTLRDRGNVNVITVNGTNFPLTGVLVGSQYDVAYNFDPLLSSDDHTVYDSNIVDGSNNSIYMLPYQTTAFTQTLVMPTRKDEVVYIVLEFENKTGVDFYGANGLILKDSKFYMTAKLDPTSASNYDSDDKTKNRVFVQDGVTEVSCQINDLKGAWNVVPDLRDPQLEIGVSIETKWIQSTTTNVMLD